ncbi:MAG: hypothetical protein FJW26_18445 [Acidimicrobiia bacterium]|nr:hypothetical protein [Acidimicrobiia bacterium]
MVRWKSKDLLFAAMLLWAGTVPGFTGSAPVKKDAASAPQAREDNRRFGTVFNNDINNLLYAVDSKLSAGEIIADYRRGLGEILAAKPGILAQNVGMPDPVIYRSKVATPWNKYVEGSQSEVVQKLLDTGTDPLTLTISECRKQGVRVVASYRMNAEDFKKRELEIFDFGRANRHLAIPGANCLDPAHPEVYAHYMAIFREVAEKYDVDGIEFDFRRWARMVSNPLENHTVLTRMVRGTRAMLDEVGKKKGGKRLILGVRVGPSLDTPEVVAKYAGAFSPGMDGSCKELGLDVKTWIERELVDYVSPSLFWPRWPGHPHTREFVALAKGKNIGIYPTLFPLPLWLDQDQSKNKALEPGDTERLKKYKDGFCEIALKMYEDGADGISTFNWYFHLHLARMPKQWQAYYGYGMGGSAIQKYVLSILADPQAIRRYRSAAWMVPPH